MAASVHLLDKAVCVAVAIRFGVLVSATCPCQCGFGLDEFENNTLCCKRGAACFTRHATVNGFIADSLHSASLWCDLCTAVLIALTSSTQTVNISKVREWPSPRIGRDRQAPSRSFTCRYNDTRSSWLRFFRRKIQRRTKFGFVWALNFLSCCC